MSAMTGTGVATSEPLYQSWDIDLPFTTPLSLNDRMHHMAKAKLVALWRQSTAVAVRAAGVPHANRIKATLFYVPNSQRRRDPDNLVASYKPAIDALVDAGVVDDDTQDYVERVWPIICEPDRTKERGSRFTLRIEIVA